MIQKPIVTSPLQASKNLCFEEKVELETYLYCLLPGSVPNLCLATQHQLQSLLGTALWHDWTDTVVYVTELESTPYPLNTQDHGCGQSLIEIWASPCLPRSLYYLCVIGWVFPLSQPMLVLKRCTCSQTLDQFGDHVLGCDYKNLRIRQHEAFTDVLFHALQSDNSNCIKEQHCGSDNFTRPSDISP